MFARQVIIFVRPLCITGVYDRRTFPHVSGLLHGVGPRGNGMYSSVFVGCVVGNPGFLFLRGQGFFSIWFAIRWYPGS